MDGSEIKKYREDNNLSQEELAGVVGLTRKTINTYENRGSIPRSKIELFKFLFTKGKKVIEEQKVICDKLTEEEIYEVIERIHLHEDELMTDTRFSNWLKEKESKAVNTALKDIIRNKNK